MRVLFPFWPPPLSRIALRTRHVFVHGQEEGRQEASCSEEDGEKAGKKGEAPFRQEKESSEEKGQEAGQKEGEEGQKACEEEGQEAREKESEEESGQEACGQASCHGSSGRAEASFCTGGLAVSGSG